MSGVYAAISAVMHDLAEHGIGKDRDNLQQGYKFRGIDDVYNALAPLLVKHGLLVLPNVLERTVTQYETGKGTLMFNVVLRVDFQFIYVEDATMHHAVFYGEASDTGDKATNKAMSAAFKYACIEVFCIPTVGDNDADSSTPEPVRAKSNASPKTGVFENLSPETQNRLTDLSIAVADYFKVGQLDDCFIVIEEAALDSDEKVALSSLLSSKIRTAMTKERDRRRAVAIVEKATGVKNEINPT